MKALAQGVDLFAFEGHFLALSKFTQYIKQQLMRRQQTNLRASAATAKIPFSAACRTKRCCR
ncbi:MAG: hypothetical protein IPJ73_08885 [Zoogloea sp.]|nr:hypothetical protein [Zoogloea sp.]